MQIRKASDVPSPRAIWPPRYYGLIAILLFSLALLGPSSALADGSSDSGAPAPGSPAAEDEILAGLRGAIENGNPEESKEDLVAVQTDFEAAEELPHRELDRAEALELMQRVFGLQLQAPAGIFDDLEVERFLSNYAGVIPADGRPAPNGVVVGGGEATPQDTHPVLLESTIPLRAPSELGGEQAVDLSLEDAEGQLVPANPLVEVGVPQELGEGIELPEAGVQIELVGGPQERSPSTVGQSVAGYPEVAKDTSLAVAPTPTGVETLTLLQSADSPRSETFRLDMPNGATLQQPEGGGAEVVDGEATLLVIEPPTAIDAEGQDVPVSLEVAGDTLTLEASPGAGAAYPILVDPVYDTFNWNGTTTTSGTWAAFSNGSTFATSTSAQCSNTAGAVNQCGTPLTQYTPGFYISANSGGSLATGSWLHRDYFVPRAASDYSAYGTLPSSFIESMTINHIGYWHRSDPAASPFLAAGIWAGAEAPVWGTNPAGWASVLTWGANQGDINETLQFTFPGNNNHNAKEALVGMVATEPHTMTAYRDELFREVTVSLGDVDKPGFAPLSPPTGWMDKTALPISFTVSDSGLGVSSLTTTDRQTPQHSWTTSKGCAGTNNNPCPHTWKSTDSGSPALKYEPSLLPTGISTLDVKAIDPVGNVSTVASAPVKVDHTAPTVNLSGTMTEQATRGPSRPRYILKVGATDGIEASPQSGVASVKVSVDGKQVQLTQPGCTTQNCQLSTEWTLTSSLYQPGAHTVVVVATDAVGRSTTKELTIQIQPDTTKPTYSLSGEFQEAPESWVTQRNYAVSVAANDGGYGVTKVQFLVDGKAAKGGAAEQTCSEGACSLTKTFTINMTAYSGGEHTGTVAVTDGAGNKAELSNPFRVDPSGTISAAEAAKTLAAVEVTSGETIIAPSPGAKEESGETPGLVTAGGGIQTVGTVVTSKMSTSQATGITIEAPGGTAHFAPTGVAGTATPAEIVNGSASVSGNTSANADTSIRPVFDGVLSYAAIRASTAPEEYAWTVELPEGATLHEESTQVAEVYYKDGTAAMAIAAEGAHDATGAEVPTSLKISNGNILTLTVHHKVPPQGQPTYVYPIVAGAQYETGYETPIVTVAPEAKEEEEAQLKLAEEELFRAEQEKLQHEIEVLEQEIQALELKIAESGMTLGSLAVSPPELIPVEEGDGASASGVPKYQRRWGVPICASAVVIDGCEIWEQHIRGFFYYNYLRAWWKDGREPVCSHFAAISFSVDTEACEWIGPNFQLFAPNAPLSDYHISAQVRFYAGKDFIVTERKGYHPVTIRGWGDGFAKAYPTDKICNPMEFWCKT